MKITASHSELIQILDRGLRKDTTLVYMCPPNRILILDQNDQGYTYVSSGMFISHSILLSPNACQNLRYFLQAIRRQLKNSDKPIKPKAMVSIEPKKIEIIDSEIIPLEYETNAVTLPYDNALEKKIEGLSKSMFNSDIDAIKVSVEDFKKIVMADMITSEKKEIKITEGQMFLDGEEVQCVSQMKNPNRTFEVNAGDLLFIRNMCTKMMATQVVFVISDTFQVVELYNFDDLICKIHKKHLQA